MAGFLPVQLATLVDAPPVDEGWAWETKYDGYRLEAVVSPGRVHLYTRNGNDWTDRFPTVAARLRELRKVTAVLDGEVVALERSGTSNFGKLQEYLGGELDLRPVYFVFDLLSLDGKDLRALPLEARRTSLDTLFRRAVIGRPRDFRLGERLRGSPATLLDRACARGREGIIGKRLGGRYVSGRDRSWIKVKCGNRQEFVILGFTEPKNSRTGFGSLLLGVHQGKSLRYAGRVGSGFNNSSLAALHRKLQRLRVVRPVVSPLPAALPSGVTWVRPSLVAEVSFSEWTRDGALRHPVFLGLREDKPAGAIQQEEKVVTTTAKPRRRRTEDALVAGVEITHPDRVVYPRSKLTKLDLARFYERIASRILPHLAGRPLSLVRCPEGSAGTCFFQKHWVGALPGSLDSVGITQSDRKKHPYVVVNDVTGLVTLIQWGVMEIHPWGSRADQPEKPDRIFFDLDPGPGVGWVQIQEAALGLRSLLDELGLKSWVKTSGGKGLHVVVPIARRPGWDEVAAFAQGVAVHMATHFPDHFIAKASKAARKGKIFVDWLRNTRGATAVAAWSARARPEAGVSVPIAWKDVREVSSGDEFTIATLQSAPLSRSDPWKGLLESRQSLTAAMLRQLDV